MAFFRSFRGILAIGVVLTHAAITPILFSSILLYVDKGYQAQFIDNARAMSNLLATQIAQFDIKNDRDALIGFLDELMLGGQLSFLEILRDDGSALTPPSGQITHSGFAEDFYFAQHDDHVYFVAMPITFGKGRQNANIRFGYDEIPIQGQIDTAFQRGAYLALAYLIIMVTIMMLLARRLTRSLDQLRTAANKISGGDTNNTLSIDTSITEFASLAHDLEQMRFALVRQNKMIQRREAFIRAIMDNMAEAMIVIDEDLNIDSINTATENVFGYSEGDIVGEPFNCLFQTDNRAAVDLFLLDNKGSDTGNGDLSRHEEWEAKRKSGILFTVELSLSRIVLDEQQLIVCNLHDITLRKQTEYALIQARSDAEEANRAKSLFLSTMSHELRTPLNAVIGYSEMLMDDAHGRKDDAAMDDLKKIRSAGQHLLSLINNILDLSKIEAGKMELDLHPFKLKELLADTVNATKPMIEKNGNMLDVTINCENVSLVSDETKLRQIIINLLSNAAKFTQNGTVQLKAECTEEDGETWLNIAITDTGMGIAEENIERLFENFSQANVTIASKYGGTGLGLSISRKFCQLMGGDISVTSIVNRGSTFLVRVPATVVSS